MKLAAALFDFDGTLFQTKQVHFLAIRTIMENFLGERVSNEELQSMVGVQYHERVARMLALRGMEVSQEKQKALVKEARDVMQANENPSGMLTPGAPELLEALAAASIPIALVTSTFHHRAEPFLEEVGLLHYFSLLTCSEDVMHRKPNQEPFENTVNQLGVDTAACIVFEDSEAGISSAHDAGITTIVGMGPVDDPALAGSTTTAVDFTAISIETLVDLLP